MKSGKNKQCALYRIIPTLQKNICTQGCYKEVIKSPNSGASTLLVFT